MPAPAAILVHVNCANEKEARRIAQAAVERHLAAAANVFPAVRSCFRWDGDIQWRTEATILFKTVRENFDPLRTMILKLHSYEQPAVIALPIAAGDEGYLSWVDGETRD